MLLVAEILRHRKPRLGDSHTDAGGLVHLTEDKRCLLQHAGFLHFTPQIVALAGTLADAGEDRVAAVLRRNIVDKLLDQHGLADTGTAEETDLAALRVRFQKVDNLDTCLQHLDHRALILERRSLAVNAPELRSLIVIQGRTAVERLSERVEHTAEHVLADRNKDSRTG